MAVDTREKSKERFQKWYEKNADKIRERKRSRYKSDPMYRDRVLAWSRAYKKTHKKPSLDRIPGRVQPPATQWKSTEIEIDGVKISVFTIGALAKVLGKGISTLRMWEKEGVLPSTPYRNDKGDRLYPYDMVTRIRRKLIDDGRINPALNKKKERAKDTVKRVRYADGREEDVKLMKINVLADALRKKPLTIFNLERGGYLPKTPLVASTTQYRLYTAEMVSVVKASFDAVGYPTLTLKGVRATPIHDRILDEWRRLGVLGAQVVEDGTDESDTSDGSSGESKAPRKLFGGKRKHARNSDAAEPSVDDSACAEALQAGG